MLGIFKDETSSDKLAPASDNGTLAEMAEGDILSVGAEEFTGISEQLGTSDAQSNSQAATKNVAQGSNETVTQNEAQINNADSNPDAEPSNTGAEQSNTDAEPSNTDDEQDAPEENICEPESEQSDLIENVGEPSGFSEQTDPETESSDPTSLGEDTYSSQSHAEAFERDLRDLLSEFPELRSALRGGVSTKRYAELRALGLTVREAYLAASAPRGRDNRAHIVSGVPSGARSPELGMSSVEMELARSIFHGLSENEIKRLYSQVTK